MLLTLGMRGGFDWQFNPQDIGNLISNPYYIPTATPAAMGGVMLSIDGCTIDREDKLYHYPVKPCIKEFVV